MPKIAKDVIRPGKFRVGDREVEVTDQDIDRWVDNFNRMRSENLWVPAPYEHPEVTDDEGFPVDVTDGRRKAARERAKFNAGWVEEIRKRDDGSLEAVFDIPDEDKAKSLQDVGSFVSPQFGPWTDSTGKRWDNVISHIAFTTRPVNREQTKQFTEVPVAALSEPIQFSLENLVQMADKPPFMESDDDDGGTDIENDGTDNDDLLKPGDDKDDQVMQQVRQAFASIGVVIPEGTKISGDLQTLVAAIQTHMATKNLEKQDRKPDGQDGAEQGVREETDVMTMSELHQELVQFSDGKDADATIRGLKKALSGLGIKITDGSDFGTDVELLADLLANLTRHIEFRSRRAKEMAHATPMAMSEDANQEDDEVSQVQLSRLTQEMTDLKREKFEARVTALLDSGRCDKPTADALREKVQQYQFSASDEPNAVENDLALRLEMLEGNPEGTFWSDEQKIKQFAVTEEERHRAFFDGDDMDDETAEKLAEKVS